MGFRCEVNAAYHRALEIDSAKHAARALGWPYVDLESYSISCGVLRKLPRELACRWRCVPLIFNSHRVVLVVDDPFNGAYIAAEPFLLGPPYNHRIELALTTSLALDMALHKRVTVVRE